ncbi:MAG: nickel pincer cofactor biosynthesis protein LarB [Deltaproteobacteria bacterium]|nr:nickel pincer cofactor biosynthesis protein LarB [Candidatus Tharpella sp.]
MNRDELKNILDELKRGERRVDEVADLLEHLPFRDLGIAHLDTHRGLRSVMGEVVFALGKEISDIGIILKGLLEHEDNILVTRLESHKAAVLQPQFPQFTYHAAGQYFVKMGRDVPDQGRGLILLVTAGTSDLRVAYEAEITLRMMGQRCEKLVDVGVAGIHRLLAYREKLLAAEVLIVIAGMEGALPSVVAGLVDKPVIAVPTSIGYGASFGGVAALLGMLNSCAGGVGVVNIDNGFGAAYLAALINRD